MLHLSAALFALHKKARFITLFLGLACGLQYVSAQESMLLIPYRSGNLWGLAHPNGKIEVKPAYHNIRSIHYVDNNDFPLTGFFEMQEKDKVEVLQNNRVLIALDKAYDSVTLFPDLYYPIRLFKDGRQGLWYGNREAITCTYDSVRLSAGNTSYLVSKNGLWGLVNAGHRPVIPAKYADIRVASLRPVVEYDAVTIAGKTDRYRENICKVSFDGVPLMDDPARSLLSETDLNRCRTRLGDRYQEVEIYRAEELAVVAKDGKKGITSLMEQIHSDEILKYDEVQVVSRNYAIVAVDGKQGVISRVGRELVPVDYDRIVYQQQDGDDAFILTLDGHEGAYFADPYSREKHKGTIAPKYRKLDLVSGVEVGSRRKFYLFMAENEAGVRYIVDETGREYYDAGERRHEGG